MIKRNLGYLSALSAEEANPASQQLETEGYVLVPRVFTPGEVDNLEDDINQIFDTVPADERIDRPAEHAEMFRYEMLNRSAVCQQALGSRGMLDVIEPLLGDDCHVIANTAWRNPPNSTGNHGGERWHIDAGPHVPLAEGVTWPEGIPHPVFAIGTHIYLKECRLEDGPTGVIPGSHLSGQFPPRDRAMDDSLTWRGSKVRPLLAKPGDVGFFVSDVWHRRMPTQSGDQGRFFLQVHYGRRDIAQRIRTTRSVNHLDNVSIDRAVTDRDRTVIGIHRPFFYDG